MTFTEAELREYIQDARAELDFNTGLWRDGSVAIDGVTNITRNTGKQYNRLATGAALLGVVRDARNCFGEAARIYLEQIRATRLRRDIRERILWEGEPRVFFRALNAGLLSRDESLLTEIATEAIEVDESYLDEFASDYPDSPAQYYDMKVHAALVLGDERAATFLDELRDVLDVITDKSQYWEVIPRYYQALLDESASATEAALRELHDFFAGEEPDPDDPNKYVLHDVCAYIVLARRHGLDVSIDSDRLPEVLLKEDIPHEDVELDVDFGNVQVTSDVGLFELERDDDGSPVIAGRIYHPGGREVTAEDVPEREAGQVLSDEWVDAALDEAAWRDHYADDLVADAQEAFADGSLTRKLVVVQDRTDEHLFDESLTTLPIDDIELLKGAGRR
ncbi:Immunity protein 49 [Halomicrobium zhouii]|uniref:Immunity protein 49 n=1 Tax=Halomicrobium zhouii TaxID=767519 RepID=A0A1I6L3I2_9EURY|nr:Imm49 family immunity protein [Halomicrobium zhouii]SFR98043.1 Immunity protein 49 [Halomicrobium zhouii]